MNEITLINNTAAFRTPATIKTIGDTWGVNLTMPPAYQSVHRKLAALRKMHQATPTTAAFSLLITAHEEDEWAEGLTKLAATETEHRIIREGFEEAQKSLTQRQDYELNSGETYNHIIAQLPVNEVEEDFIEAVQTLGQKVFDVGAAVDFDAEAAHMFRIAGRKLLILQGLNNKNVQNFPSALFGHITEPIPQLVTINNEQQFTQSDLDANHRVGLARQGIKDQGTFITNIALGRKPGIELQVARNWEELVRRSRTYARAGTITRK